MLLTSRTIKPPTPIKFIYSLFNSLFIPRQESKFQITMTEKNSISNLCVHIVLVYCSHIAKMELGSKYISLPPQYMCVCIDTYRQAPRICTLKFNQPLGQRCITNMCNPDLIITIYHIQH